MVCTSYDLTIEGALADPMIAAAMRADHVDPRRFEAMLRSTAQRLVSTRRVAATPPVSFGRPARRTAGACVAW